MSGRPAVSKHLFVSLLSIAAGLAVACSDKATVTGNSTTGTVSGTVILGSSSTSTATTSAQRKLEGVEIGLGGVTVRHAGSGRSTMTDSSGNFTLSGIPAGNTELELDRTDIHARAPIIVAGGSTTTVTISVSGSTAVTVPRGHAGEEIEGLIQAMDASSLTVLDQRLGAVVVKVTATTVIRQGDQTIALSDLKIGQRVHVKALIQTDNSYEAVEIQLQNQNVGGQREVEGSVSSVDAAAHSFVVSTGGTTITVTTDSSTRFKKRGSSASFADVAVGTMVDVKGILQADGKVLASKVDIES